MAVFTSCKSINIMKNFMMIFTLLAVTILAGNHPADMKQTDIIGGAPVYGVPSWSGFLFCDGDEDVFPRYPAIEDVEGLQDTIKKIFEKIDSLPGIEVDTSSYWWGAELILTIHGRTWGIPMYRKK